MCTPQPPSLDLGNLLGAEKAALALCLLGSVHHSARGGGGQSLALGLPLQREQLEQGTQPGGDGRAKSAGQGAEEANRPKRGTR